MFTNHSNTLDEFGLKTEVTDCLKSECDILLLMQVR